MISFEREHECLLCIDSDGTVMDTMTSKHEESLGPAFIEVFNINEHKDEVLKEWVRINCFSHVRGYNRFHTLTLIIEYVKQFGYTYDGFEAYKNWEKNTHSLSIPSLEEELSLDDTNTCIAYAVKWAKRANELIALMKDALPFEKAIESIKKLSCDADLIGVSTANKKALTKEWTSVGIFDCFKLVASQEYGTKSLVVKTCVDKGYAKNKVVMIGDSYGDLEAAKNNGILFYPIIPNHENESWEYFINVAYPKLINGEYTKEYEEMLVGKYNDSLN